MKKTFTAICLVVVAAVMATTAVGHPHKRNPGKGSVKIIRDDFGVPHVYGSTTRALFYGVGYAQAQDRLWQADIHRRLATGTLAEFLGPNAVPGDIFARKMFGPYERRLALLETITSEGRIILQAFTDGMNAWIEEAAASGQLPVEYGAQGLTARPWTVDDSVAAFMFLASQFGWFGSEEIDNFGDLQELVAIHGQDEGLAVFADTHWLDDPDAPTSVPGHGAQVPPRFSHDARTRMPRIKPQDAASFDRVIRGWKKNLRKANIGEGPASNAVVLGPRLSRDGHALLLGGPQMGYSTPQVNHEIGIHGAGFDVTGTQIAGLPGVQIGVGKRLAWTLTSGVSDNSDIYQEHVVGGQYLFNGALLDFDCRDETINVRFSTPVSVPVCESIHGPVLAEAPGVAFSFKNSSRNEELTSWQAWLNLGRAKSIDDFENGLAAIAYSFNVLYGDARGNIAYWHIGRVPVRAEGDNPWLPHDGTGGAEWQGYRPWEEMPHARNPKRGWLTSWNNKPEAGWQNSVAGFGTFGPVHRVYTLINILEDLPPHSATLATLADINRIAGSTTDTPSGSARTVFAPTMLDDLIARIAQGLTDDPKYGDVVTLLEEWDWLQTDADQDGFYDQPAVAVFNSWWQKLVERVFYDDLGTTGQPNVVSNLLARMLDDDPAIPLLHDYLKDGETIEQAVTQAFKATVDAYSAVNEDRASWLAPAAYIHWPSVGAAAVPDTVWMNRGTYNQLVHLGKGRKLYGENVVAPGQSGDPLSDHFADQLKLYATWNYKPMILKRRDLEGYTEDVTKLKIP